MIIGKIFFFLSFLCVADVALIREKHHFVRRFKNRVKNRHAVLYILVIGTLLMFFKMFLFVTNDS